MHREPAALPLPHPVAPQARPGEILVFLHLPSTGGADLINLLFQQMGGAFLFVQDSQWGDLSFRELAAMTREDFASVAMIGGHETAPLLNRLPCPARAVTFLRDPALRAWSNWHHQRLTEGAAAGPFSAFVREHRNFQCRAITGLAATAGDDELFAHAAERVRDAFACAPTSAFEELIVVLALHFGWPSLRPWHRITFTPQRPPLGEADPADLALFEELNQADQRLYRLACEDWQRRTAALGVRFSDTLTAYREFMAAQTSGEKWAGNQDERPLNRLHALWPGRNDADAEFIASRLAADPNLLAEFLGGQPKRLPPLTPENRRRLASHVVERIDRNRGLDIRLSGLAGLIEAQRTRLAGLRGT